MYFDTHAHLDDEAFDQDREELMTLFPQADVSLILNSNTFVYVDMYLVYDEVDLSGSLNWIDIESGIQIA